ncbi:hypothetical protein RI129_004562 [Pyrocoelia pectoralis]|uniref:DDE Tnp4 domain-containing protein n=1 Tax=Pyrocoelia pectoralis TaxID=417401 RepID=A0AAN7VJ50_9COLE
MDVGSYGKEDDAGIFQRSTLGKMFNNGTLLPPPRKLPNSDCVLPHVFVDNSNAIFNYRLCRARRTSENTFDLLAQVFRIIYTPINLLPETVDDVIIVSCCFHNLLRDAYISKAGPSYYHEHYQTLCKIHPQTI